jgi:plasmid segregation protein ParM
MSGENIWCIGIDDGYAETKIVLPDGTSYRMPSQAKAGDLKQIGINGGKVDGTAYRTPDGSFVVGDLRENDPTSFDGYPTSSMNRVIVSHALRQAGVPGNAEIFACSGLPVKSFYHRGQLNQAMVKAKTENLMKNDVRALDDRPLPKFVKHTVLSEGIAAWMDYVLQLDGEELVINTDLASRRMAIIDIGGRTTDIAVIQDHKLDMSRSNTINVGMLMVRDILIEAIKDEFDIIPSVEQMNQLIDTKQIKMYGSMVSAEEMWNSARTTAVARIHSEVMRQLNKAADIDEVIFVGGTVAAFADQIDNWFPHQRIGFDPAFANARGMMKYCQFVMGSER